MKQKIDSLYAVVCESEKAVKELSRSNEELVNSSAKKRRKSSLDTVVESFTIDAPEQEKTPEAMAVGPQRTFGNAFAVPRDPFIPTTLATMDLQDFIYQWYSKKLGTVGIGKKGETKIHTWLWSIPQGDKKLNDTISDDKNIMKLAVMVANEQELNVLRRERPDAAKDSSYEVWEINMKKMSQKIESLVGDWLLSKEDKIGKAKKMTVNALARRWQNIKYTAPEETELSVIREQGVGQ